MLSVSMQRLAPSERSTTTSEFSISMYLNIAIIYVLTCPWICTVSRSLLHPGEWRDLLRVTQLSWGYRTLSNIKPSGSRDDGWVANCYANHFNQFSLFGSSRWTRIMILFVERCGFVRGGTTGNIMRRYQGSLDVSLTYLPWVRFDEHRELRTRGACYILCELVLSMKLQSSSWPSLSRVLWDRVTASLPLDAADACQ